MAIRRQEIYCHECGNYVQFTLDDELDGEHILTCPVCGHLHYRYVDRGRITDQRWASSMNYMTYNVVSSSVTYSATSSGTDSSGFITWGNSYGSAA